MYNKNTFWDFTQSNEIEIKGEYTSMKDAIKEAISLYYTSDEDVINTNGDGSAFFIRKENFAIRISKTWGKVGNCDWNLKDKRKDSDMIVMGIIRYDKLNPLK